MIWLKNLRKVRYRTFQLRWADPALPVPPGLVPVVVVGNDADDALRFAALPAATRARAVLVHEAQLRDRAGAPTSERHGSRRTEHITVFKSAKQHHALTKRWPPSGLVGSARGGVGAGAKRKSKAAAARHAACVPRRCGAKGTAAISTMRSTNHSLAPPHDAACALMLKYYRSFCCLPSGAARR